MKIDVVENFRDINGEFIGDECICNVCGKQSEVCITLSCDVGYNTDILLCKGCLTNMIKYIDKSYTKYASLGRNIKIYDEDDGCCD